MATMVLLVIGVAGFVGTTLVGTLLKRGLYLTLIGIPVLMAGIATSLTEPRSQRLPEHARSQRNHAIRGSRPDFSDRACRDGAIL